MKFDKVIDFQTLQNSVEKKVNEWFSKDDFDSDEWLENTPKEGIFGALMNSYIQIVATNQFLQKKGLLQDSFKYYVNNIDPNDSYMQLQAMFKPIVQVEIQKKCLSKGEPYEEVKA